MKVQSIKIFILVCGLFFLQSRAQADSRQPDPLVEVDIERVGSMTHFEFNGHKEWTYDLKKEGSEVHLTLPKISNKSLEKLKEFSSLLIGQVKIDNETANKTRLILSLSDDRIESFDYMTQNPNNLVVDFFVTEDSILSEIRTKKDKREIAENKSAKKEKKESRGKKTKAPERKPAFAEYIAVDQNQVAKQKEKNRGDLPLAPSGSIEQLFDFGSLSSGSFNEEDLEAKVIEAEGNIYLRFPILKLKNRHLQELQSFHPEYKIRKSFSDENKQARRLLDMFNQRSFASFIKAKKIFKKNFESSSYDEILSYVEADSWVELWKLNKRQEYLTKAMNIYKMLIERYPNSKIAERTLINAGLLAHDVGEYFVATKMLRRYLKNFPTSPFNNHIKIYLADSLAHLNNFESARAAMDQVVDAEERDTAAEATYRTGDIYFLKQSYRRAERAYDNALKKYPQYADRFPNAIFNKAEAQFNLAEYPSSLESYKSFFGKYPNHPFSSYALTRIGELIDLLYGDKRKAQGFYNESFFRFRNSMGGTIARMRSLSQRFQYMKEKELKSAISEIREREKAIDLHQVDEFASFMISDGFYERGDHLAAANKLINYFQINPKPVNIKKFEKRISRAIAGEVRKLLRKGAVVEALDIIESHQKSWLSKSRRVDVQLFRAKAYEKMKLFDEALASYQRIEKRMSSLQGTKEERERKVFEYYPTFDQIRLRLAVAEYHRGNKAEALGLLKKVKSIQGLDPLSKVDFHLTLSKLSFDKNKFGDAMKIVNLVEPEVIEDPEQRENFSVYLSKVYEKNEMFDKAISILEKFYEKFKGEQDQVYVLSRLFELYRIKGMEEKAIATGQDLLESYDKKYNLDKERYYLGELHFKKNNQKQALKIWKDLTKKSMWSELARNKQVSGDWETETNDKINRIPAMAK